MPSVVVLQGGLGGTRGFGSVELQVECCQAFKLGTSKLSGSGVWAVLLVHSWFRSLNIQASPLKLKGPQLVHLHNGIPGMDQGNFLST